MVFCNYNKILHGLTYEEVTILILIDGFLQCGNEATINEFINSHNPYFNRWFSAILIKITLLVFVYQSQSLF